MAEAVYVLCALTSAVCAGLLLRSYFRSRARLLVWSSLAFVGLTLNNVLLFVDLVMLPETIDLWPIRNLTALLALSVLVYGLIWDTE
jgi:hypothetical protein